MKILIPRLVLEGLYAILKKYFIVQEFTSVHKITTKEKKLYNDVAKLLEEKK
jgi:hypothetical protein